MTAKVQVTAEEIAKHAYVIWEREGRPEGRAAEHWYQAEAMLRTRDGIAATDTDEISPKRPAPRSSPSRANNGKRQKRLEPIS